MRLGGRRLMLDLFALAKTRRPPSRATNDRRRYALLPARQRGPGHTTGRIDHPRSALGVPGPGNRTACKIAP